MKIKSENKSIQCVIWNMIGSIVAASSSFVLLLCVTRTVGAKEGGIFSLAFATSQILLTVGKFGVRSFQATDVKNEIDFSVYFKNRIWFCGIMVVLSVVYVLISGYDWRKSAIFIAVCVIKMVDALEDVFHGQLQSCGKLDVAGKLLTVRNLFTMVVFGVWLVLSRNLLETCIITAVLSVFGGSILNVVVSRSYFVVSYDTKGRQTFTLLKACFPLFIGSFLSLYIYNAPKYALDRFGSEEEITYYAIIFMPAFIINLFSEFVFKPLLTQIALLWNEGKFERFYKTIFRFMINIGVITFLVVGGTYLWGAQILSFIYKVDIVSYRKELVILIISGGFSAAVYLLYNVLTSMRLQVVIISNYILATVIITILAFLGVYYWKIEGAAVAYLITEVVLFGCMVFGTYRGYYKGVRSYENRDCNISTNE